MTCFLNLGSVCLLKAAFVITRMARFVIDLFDGLCSYVTNLGGNMARFTQFPIMITRSTIIYEIISPGAAGSSIYV